MKAISHELASARPGLLGRTVPSGTNSGAIKVVARVAGNTDYVFAVNTQRLPITAQIHVPRLRDGSLQVLREKRSVKVESNRFDDNFQALAVHVYIRPH